eukprot:6207898-Pleurochrysis_carterae.AAC.4
MDTDQIACKRSSKSLPCRKARRPYRPHTPAPSAAGPTATLLTARLRSPARRRPRRPRPRMRTRPAQSPRSPTASRARTRRAAVSLAPRRGRR